MSVRITSALVSIHSPLRVQAAQRFLSPGTVRLRAGSANSRLWLPMAVAPRGRGSPWPWLQHLYPKGLRLGGSPLTGRQAKGLVLKLSLHSKYVFI